MREPVGGTVRIPNSNWSGYGFSKSSPSYQMRQQFQQAGLLKKAVNRANASSHWDEKDEAKEMGVWETSNCPNDAGETKIEEWGDTKWSVNDGGSSVISRGTASAGGDSGLAASITSSNQVNIL